MAETIDDEFIGQANMNNLEFSGYLLTHKEIVPETFEVFLDNRRIAMDDGNGNLEGSFLVNSARNVIDYENQSYNIEITDSAVSGESRITATYKVAESMDTMNEIRSMADTESEEVPYELADENVVDRLIDGDLSASHVTRMLEERVIGDNENVEEKLSNLAENFSINGS